MTLFGEHVGISDIILNGILALAGIAILVSVISLQRKNGPWENFNLVHLITNKEGYPDGAKCVEWGVFLLMSWGFITMMIKGTITEAYIGIYTALFVTRGAYGAYLRSTGKADEAGTVTTTRLVTDTKKTEVAPANNGEPPPKKESKKEHKK